MERPVSWGETGSLGQGVNPESSAPTPGSLPPILPGRAPAGALQGELLPPEGTRLGVGGAPGDGCLRLILVLVQLGGLTSRIPLYPGSSGRNLGGSHCPGPALQVGQQLLSGRVQLPAGHRAEGEASALLFHG